MNDKIRSNAVSDEMKTPAAGTIPHLQLLSIFLIFLRLGASSFGGPIAHLGYFRLEFVERRKWLDEHAYADLVSLCQFLPGPASSQVGMAIGLTRGGIPGAMAAWLGFTLPSALIMVLFGLSLSAVDAHLGGGWLRGLKIVAVAVVAQALWGMGKTLSSDRLRATVTVCAAIGATILPTASGQIGMIVAGGLFGWACLRNSVTLPHSLIPITTSRTTGLILLAVFFVLLFVPLIGAGISNNYIIRLFDNFYRAGALVFGGGHVVLPLLQAQVVPAGWVSNNVFLAGYGAAQAVPGPLFSFAAFLGAVSTQTPAGWLGASIALIAIFMPAFLLVVGILPFWERLRRFEAMRRAMLGIDAAVVGLLLAAFYNPIWTSAIHSAVDFCLAALAFLVLVFWKVPPWLVVVLAASITGAGVG
ncbi:MAG: chromate efflux transporter [Sulfuriferula sp.]